MLGYNNIETPNVEYHFRFRLSNVAYPNDYLRIMFPKDNMPDLGDLDRCGIEQIIPS